MIYFFTKSKSYYFNQQKEGNRNKRSVWSINTKPFSKAHFAVYPEQLVKIMINSGCPENGIVLDPFMGSGTTAVVAKKLNRNFIGFELNPDYVKIINERIYDELGMFHFGGSTHCLIFGPQVKLDFDLHGQTPGLNSNNILINSKIATVLPKKEQP